jgi:hypothetical protein
VKFVGRNFNRATTKIDENIINLSNLHVNTLRISCFYVYVLVINLGVDVKFRPTRELDLHT